MQLRNYQQQAVNALWGHIREREDNPVLVLPTGAGKGVILAQMARDVISWGGRMAIVSHVKELLQQTAGNITAMAPEIPVGVYSAGLGKKEMGYAVTVAGIQSCYDKAEEFGQLDIIAIDEAHRIPQEGEGMYRTFLQAARGANNSVRLVGLTATPYRTGSGLIAKPENLLNTIAFDVGVRQLIAEGWLSPLKSKVSLESVDTSKVGVRGGEFIQSDLQAAMMGDQELVVKACLEIAQKTQDRKSVLVFATGIDHAQMISRFLRDIEGDDVTREIYGDTPTEERAKNIADFRAGAFKYLVNVDVLTTGFDAPNVDCVAVLRPTMSPGLWVQMVGRGFRLSHGKVDCLVLDFGRNLMRHGPVDRIMISDAKEGGQREESDNWKECPNCQEVVPRGCEVCPDCGTAIPVKKREIKHDATAGGESPLAEPEPPRTIYYSKHIKKGSMPGHPATLKVTYCFGMTEVHEFVCFEHQWFARDKAVAWWRARSDEPPPVTVDGALNLIKQSGLKEPAQALLAPDEKNPKYLRVARVMDLQPMSEARRLTLFETGNTDDVPF